MSEEKKIRVMIVDDHTVVRSGLAAFLLACPDFDLVAEARNGEHALRLLDSAAPDVVLMDLVMPGMDGATATEHIRRRCPHTQVLALTSFKEKEQVQAALRAGAIGYLLKDISSEDLAKAIRAAHAGRPTLAPEAAQVLIAATRPQEPEPGADLTAREREILRLMADGLNNQQIAERLVLGVSTVKTHVSNVLSKLGVATRTEAAAIALKKIL
jgi:NarL family two-component system response regulator LiaR